MLHVALPAIPTIIRGGDGEFFLTRICDPANSHIIVLIQIFGLLVYAEFIKQSLPSKSSGRYYNNS